MLQSDRDLLLRLYAAAPEEWPALISEIGDQDVPRLLETAKNEKLFPHTFTVLQTAFEIPEDYEKIWQEYLIMREETLHYLKICRDSGADYTVLKGIGIESYYPPHLKRHFRDVDVCARSLTDFTHLSRAVLANGLQILQTMSFSQNPDTGEVRGGARYDTADAPLHFRGGFEMLVHSFPITESTWLPYQAFAEHKEICEIGGVQIPVPSREGKVLVYLVELFDRAKLQMRDLFDVMMMLDDAHEIDMDYIEKNIVRYRLHYALNLLQDGFAAEPLLLAPVRLTVLCDRLLGDQAGRYTDLRRGHIWPYLNEHTSSPASGLLYGWLRNRANAWVDQERWLSLLKRSDHLMSAKQFYDRNVFVFFTLLNDVSGVWSWHRLGDADVVLTPLGSFVASLNALHSDEQLDALDAAVVEQFGVNRHE